jgi:hypothetical protein
MFLAVPPVSVAYPIQAVGFSRGSHPSIWCGGIWRRKFIAAAIAGSLRPHWWEEAMSKPVKQEKQRTQLRPISENDLRHVVGGDSLPCPRVSTIDHSDGKRPPCG